MDQSQITRYKSLDFFARQVVEGFITGRHKSPFHGFSAEFSDYRHYNPGENTRHIDWRLYARTDRLFIKQFEDETNLRCQLLIDQSASMRFPLERHGDINQPNKITYAVYAAAVLIEILHRQRDAFGLTLFSSDIDFQTPCRSSTLHQRHLLSLLDQILTRHDNTQSPSQPDSQPLPSTLHLIAEQLHRRSLVVIFTDALLPDSQHDALLDALRHLRHNRHEVILFHILDHPHEIELDYGNRPHRFIDLETGRQIRLQPNQLAASYRDIMQQQQTFLQQHALRYNIDYIPVDTALGFHQTILPFLLKRSKM